MSLIADILLDFFGSLVFDGISQGIVDRLVVGTAGKKHAAVKQLYCGHGGNRYIRVLVISRKKDPEAVVIHIRRRDGKLHTKDSMLSSRPRYEKEVRALMTDFLPPDHVVEHHDLATLGRKQSDSLLQATSLACVEKEAARTMGGAS